MRHGNADLPTAGKQGPRARLTRPARGILAAALSLAALGILAVPGQAAEPKTVGVGVTAAPLTSSKPLQEGAAAPLTTLQVENTGTVTENIKLTVTRIDTSRRRTVQPSWVSLSTSTFSLGSGLSEEIAVNIQVPAGTPDGYYATDVLAYAVAAQGASAGTINISAGAAAVIDVTIGKAPPNNDLGDILAIVGGALVLILILGTVAVRNVRRRPASTPPADGDGTPTVILEPYLPDRPIRPRPDRDENPDSGRSDDHLTPARARDRYDYDRDRDLVLATAGPDDVDSLDMDALPDTDPETGDWESEVADDDGPASASNQDLAAEEPAEDEPAEDEPAEDEPAEVEPADEGATDEYVELDEQDLEQAPEMPIQQAHLPETAPTADAVTEPDEPRRDELLPGDGVGADEGGSSDPEPEAPSRPLAAPVPPGPFVRTWRPAPAGASPLDRLRGINTRPPSTPEADTTSED